MVGKGTEKDMNKGKQQVRKKSVKEDIKPFICAVCNKRFAQHKDVKGHTCKIMREH